MYRQNIMVGMVIQWEVVMGSIGNEVTANSLTHVVSNDRFWDPEAKSARACVWSTPPLPKSYPTPCLPIPYLPNPDTGKAAIGQTV